MDRRPVAQSSLPAFVAWLVTLLQLVGALHFALVPHGFSASLGGVVHVHGKAATQGKQAAPSDGQSHARASDGIGCSADLCTVADAPSHAPPDLSLPLAGWVAFGAGRSIAEPRAVELDSYRIFLSAPKTSPPA